jgi:hypothetical protein
MISAKKQCTELSAVADVRYCTMNFVPDTADFSEGILLYEGGDHTI